LKQTAAGSQLYLVAESGGKTLHSNQPVTRNPSH